MNKIAAACFGLVVATSSVLPACAPGEGGEDSSQSALGDSPYAEKLSDPRLHQGLISPENYDKVVGIAENYKKRNSLNLAWLNMFRSWNSGETLQNRTALESKRSKDLMIFDFDRGQPLAWSSVTFDKDRNPSTSDSEFVVALDTRNLTKPDAPVILLLLSNQHVLNDYYSNAAYQEVQKRGFVLATMEYPGYGVSVGITSKPSWIAATQDAARYLHGLTNRKVYLLGHSIGGPLALEAASGPGMNEHVAGAMSYGGFTTIVEQSKDQSDNPLISFLSPAIAWVTSSGNNFDGLGSLEALAKNNIAALVMHGELDGPVPVRHAKLYADEMQQLQAKYPNAELATKVFPGLAHEEVNNFSAGIEKSEKGFQTVWGTIESFVASKR